MTQVPAPPPAALPGTRRSPQSLVLCPDYTIRPSCSSAFASRSTFKQSRLDGPQLCIALQRRSPSGQHRQQGPLRWGFLCDSRTLSALLKSSCMIGHLPDVPGIQPVQGKAGKKATLSSKKATLSSIEPGCFCCSPSRAFALLHTKA